MKEFSISRDEVRAMGLFIHRKKEGRKAGTKGKWMCSLTPPPETPAGAASAPSGSKPAAPKNAAKKPVKKTGGGKGGKGGKGWNSGGWNSGGGGGDMSQMAQLLKVLIQAM